MRTLRKILKALQRVNIYQQKKEVERVRRSTKESGKTVFAIGYFRGQKVFDDFKIQKRHKSEIHRKKKRFKKITFEIIRFV